MTRRPLWLAAPGPSLGSRARRDPGEPKPAGVVVRPLGIARPTKEMVTTTAITTRTRAALARVSRPSSSRWFSVFGPDRHWVSLPAGAVAKRRPRAASRGPSLPKNSSARPFTGVRRGVSRARRHSEEKPDGFGDDRVRPGPAPVARFPARHVRPAAFPTFGNDRVCGTDGCDTVLSRTTRRISAGSTSPGTIHLGRAGQAAHRGRGPERTPPPRRTDAEGGERKARLIEPGPSLFVGIGSRKRGAWSPSRARGRRCRRRGHRRGHVRGRGSSIANAW